jgi:lipoate-protein ligase A
VELIREAFPARPVFDAAVSDALLQRIANGAIDSVARVYRPGPTVAFGKLDALRPGYVAATEAARAHGFEPMLRLGGGRAAAFDAGSLVVERIEPARHVSEGIDARFERSAGVVVDVLRELGVDARVGELPGEYCPGGWSVNATGRIKIAGSAQRAIKGASLVSAVVVVSGGAAIRSVLVDVYDRLGLEWDPSTAGAVEDVEPEVGVGDVEEAIVAALGLAEGEVDPATLALAEELEERHRAP